METCDAAEEGGCRVNLSVSHKGLTEKLRPLGRVKMNVRTQAQEEISSQKKSNSRVLKEVTNKYEIRPTIAKQSRPISKGYGAHQSSVIRILKRPGEVWRDGETNRPPAKSPLIGPITIEKSHGNGSGQGRPPDPPDKAKGPRGEFCPNLSNAATQLGTNGEKPPTTEPRPSGSDVAMAERSAEVKEGEEVRSTQC